MPTDGCGRAPARGHAWNFGAEAKKKPIERRNAKTTYRAIHNTPRRKRNFSGVFVVCTRNSGWSRAALPPMHHRTALSTYVYPFAAMAMPDITAARLSQCEASSVTLCGSVFYRLDPPSWLPPPLPRALRSPLEKNRNILSSSGVKMKKWLREKEMVCKPPGKL